MLLFVLAGLILAGSHLVRAEAPTGVQSMVAPGVDDLTQDLYTVTLPIVLNNYEIWTSRGMIAFERQLDNGNHDIFLMYHDGSDVQNLTDNPDADDGAPAWSPDGRFIAFSSARVGNGNRAIYKIDVKTGEVTQLTSGNGIDRWPTWSPNGDQIAFMRQVPNETPPPQYFPADIYVMDADGSNVQQLTENSASTLADEFPAWSPDGEWIVYSSLNFYEGLAYAGQDLWLMRPDGSDKHVVLRTDRPQPPSGSDKDRRDEIYPSWSPDGRIYYTYQYRDYPADKTEQLYRIWPDGTGMEKVFNDDFNRYIASFSPDGECFVFYSYMGEGDKDVWKWCNGYGAPVNLTNNSGISDEYCAWSPAR